jgi:hemolysin D
MNALTTNWSQIRTALAADKARGSHRSSIDDTDYLPAVLEIIERPASPTARITAAVLLAGVALLLGWLILGRVDIVVSASGQLVPADAVQIIQAPEPGLVRELRVREGDFVRKGQELVRLDPTVSGVELAQSEKAVATVALEVAQARAVVAALEGGPFEFIVPPEAAHDTAAIYERLARAQLAQIESATREAAAGAAAAKAEIGTASAEAAKLTQTLPMLDEQIAANERLLAKGFVSKLRVLEMRRQRTAQVHDRAAALQTLQRARSNAGGAAAGLGSTRARARTEILSQLVKSEAELRLRRDELIKTRRRSALQTLRAPVDGVVGQLGIHTIGGVVDPSKPLMTLVPSSGPLIAEVKLSSRDAGFVSIGKEVQLKLEAFPFSRYGTVPGKIIGISPDTVRDDKLGLVYVVRVALERSAIDRGDVKVPLTSGMTATADIVTGERNLLSFLTSPIQEMTKSAGRER